MPQQRYVSILILGFALALAGCGLYLPEMQEFPSTREDEKFDENDIVNQIKCELHKGVQDAFSEYGQNGPNYGNSIDWLYKWGAKVSLALTVDEKGGLNPGLTFVTPFENRIFTFPHGGNVTQSQLFSFGLGFQTSSDATRKETIGFTYAFSDLLREKPITNPCDNENGVLIHSDLKIGQFITNKSFIAKVPGTVTPTSNGASPYSTFTYEATFVVVYGGNLTPSWKLARVSANTSLSLLTIMRTKTQYVSITLGPVEQPSTPTTPAVLTQEAQNAHLAALIGQAVATAIQSQTP